jgi:glutaredoxin
MAKDNPKAKPTVYALSTCPYCKRTKRFLESHKIAYEVVDVDLLDDSKQDEVMDKVEKMTGRRSFPVVIIGKEVIVGHDEDKLRKVLNL